MTELTDSEMEQKVLDFFAKKKKMLTRRDVAAGLGIENSAAKKVLTRLVNDGRLEFTSFGGATFIKLPDAP